MKLVMRADDYGYTPIHNLGVIKSIEQGLTTHVDMLFNMPGTDDALERIKDYPWISIGWHGHCWDKPVADPKLIPSMLDDQGYFIFRNQSGYGVDQVKLEEAVIEFRAEIERCVRILGRAPDFTTIGSRRSALELAKIQVCEEFGIAWNPLTKVVLGTRTEEVPPHPRFKDCPLWMPDQLSTAYAPLWSDDCAVRDTYDPMSYFTEDPDHMLDHEAVIIAWHPGYIDDFVGYRKDFWHLVTPPIHFHDQMLKELHMLCSDELRDWVKQHNVELCNGRDVIFGTRDYQNHLRLIGSDLAV